MVSNVNRIILLLLFFIHLNTNAQTYFSSLDSIDETVWIGKGSLVIDGTNTVSIVNLEKPYGIGVKIGFSDSLISQNVEILVEGRCMSEIKNPKTCIVFTIEKDEETLYWEALNLGDFINKDKTWTDFEFKVELPRNYTLGTKIKSYLWTFNETKNTAIDDVKYTLRRKVMPSFFPNSIPKFRQASHSKIYQNQFFSINFSKDTLSVLDSKGESIINNIQSFNEGETQFWNYKSIKQKKDKTVLLFEVRNSNKYQKIEMICHNNSDKIRFQITEKYHQESNVKRNSILVNLNPKPDEIYRFNRQIHDSLLQEEYWLDKEGLKCGKGPNSFLIYHTPKVSSLQYHSSKNALLVNLDWERDHPFFRFPLAPDSTNWKHEQSYNTYSAKEVKKFEFDIYVGQEYKNIPRFLKNPDGFEATYIWSEHADHTDIRTNRAVYFGNENIINAEDAEGGFVKYNIPVTKSIFYCNPDSVDNVKKSQGLFTSLESSYVESIEYQEFLDQISEYQSEICLHTPEHFTTKKGVMKMALKNMQEKFNSPTWIDHGYTNQAHSNREDLMCDGTLKESKFYALDLWKKYDIKYVHNAYYEEYLSFMDWSVAGSVEDFNTSWGDLMPRPDYWKHTSTENLYHWPTNGVLTIERNELWGYFYNKKSLGQFVENASVKFNHCYPAWTDLTHGFWAFNADSTLVSQTGFDQTLKLLSEYRDSGALNITTIDKYLDYRTALGNITYNINDKQTVIITNYNKQPIYGLAFTIRASHISLGDKRISAKKIGKELFFWFDIMPGEEIIIHYE